jgi:hypothetical protein
MPKPGTQSRIIGIFTITLGGTSKISELVKRGNYDWFNEWITDDHFPTQPHAPVGRTIKLVEFDHDPSSEEIIQEFRRLGLKRPTYEDALQFGVEHPGEQCKHSIVFLHEPVLDPDGRLGVLALHMGVRRRGLGLYWFDVRWGRQCVLAGVRK